MRRIVAAIWAHVPPIGKRKVASDGATGLSSESTAYVSHLSGAQWIPRATPRMVRESFAEYSPNCLAAVRSIEFEGELGDRHCVEPTDVRDRFKQCGLTRNSSRRSGGNPVPDLVRPEHFHCLALEREGIGPRLTLGPPNFDVQPSDRVLSPNQRSHGVAGSDILEMLLNEGRICECAVKRGFTEPAHGALAAAVDRKTSADTLAPALTSQPT